MNLCFFSPLSSEIKPQEVEISLHSRFAFEANYKTSTEDLSWPEVTILEVPAPTNLTLHKTTADNHSIKPFLSNKASSTRRAS